MEAENTTEWNGNDSLIFYTLIPAYFPFVEVLYKENEETTTLLYKNIICFFSFSYEILEWRRESRSG